MRAARRIESSGSWSYTECAELGWCYRSAKLQIFGLNLPSMANARMHWAAKARMVKAQRNCVRLAWRQWMTPDVLPSGRPIKVLLTRYGPRTLDSDNLQSAFKGVRDQVAAELGVDDGDETKVRWEYRQEKGKPAIEIEVR